MILLLVQQCNMYQYVLLLGNSVLKVYGIDVREEKCMRPKAVLTRI